MNKKILIIEDEMVLAKALVNKFSKEGFNIATARNGEEGLEMALKQKPDLILLDIIMPKMDGLTMLEQLRKDEWGKNVKVILLTNLSDEEKLARALQEGVHDYLVKSDWKIEDVVEVVKDKLDM